MLKNPLTLALEVAGKIAGNDIMPHPETGWLESKSDNAKVEVD
jgi:hypothetical protein